MDKDLKRIDKPLETFIKAQIKNQSEETKMYFDNIHLSPLKVNNFVINIPVQHLLEYKILCIWNQTINIGYWPGLENLILFNCLFC
jgi:hypothetical protein